MVKTLRFTGTMCAACAAQIEKKLARLPGVTQANVNFLMQKITLETDGKPDTPSADHLLNQAWDIVRQVEPDLQLVRG